MTDTRALSARRRAAFDERQTAAALYGGRRLIAVAPWVSNGTRPQDLTGRRGRARSEEREVADQDSTG